MGFCFPFTGVSWQAPGGWLADKRTLNRRQASLDAHTQAALIVSAVIVGLLCTTLLSYLLLRFLRIRHDNPRYVPGRYLKKRWQQWLPLPVKKRAARALDSQHSMQEHGGTIALGASLDGRLASSQMNRSIEREASQNEDGEPDRRTSVRSVMTLPAYTADAQPTEKILGREGERGGIDTVVEFPETAEDEEARREEELESLYQIRATRRQERANRSERRQARREARSRGDATTLERLRSISRRGTSSSTLPPSTERNAATMLREHQARDRGRRISSVSYMDLGIARHDGSRVRAGSHDSERALLDDTTGVSSRRASQPHSMYQAQLHNQSTSSLRYATTDYSDDERGGSSDVGTSSTPRQVSRRSTVRRASLPTSVYQSVENVNETAPSSQPPHYDLHLTTQQQSDASLAAPPYESPTSSEALRLAPFAPAPALHIT